MKKILVATDFSPAALNAAKYAVNMAMAINADIFLLHVYQIPVSYTELPVTLAGQDMLQDAEKSMDNLKEELKLITRYRINFESEVRTGIFYYEIESLCNSISPFAVIIGSRGSTAAERFFFGAHAVYAMKHLMWPLITVPPKSKFSSIKKIVLACDFERMTTLPSEEIITLVTDFNAELHVLNISKKEEFNQELVFSLQSLKRILQPLNPAYHFLKNKNTDEGIMNFVDEHHINLLILLPKRRSLVEKLIHKGHTGNLVLHSHVPVLALHHVHS